MPATKPAIRLQVGMERNSLRPSDCLKFRCRLLNSNNGKDTHRVFTGVYFPRWRSLYIDEIVTTTVGGLRGQPLMRLVEHFPLDVYYKTVPAGSFREEEQDQASQQSQQQQYFYFVEDFVPGKTINVGPTANQRDRVARTYTITEVDDSLLRTVSRPDDYNSPAAEQEEQDGGGFQTLRLRSLPQDVKNILLRIRDAFIERSGGGVTGAFRLIGRRFRIMDDDGNRFLSKSEFIKSIADVGLKLSQNEIDKVIAAMDADGNGSIDYEEYLQVARGPMSTARKLVVHEAFQKIDLDRDGVVTMAELKTKYDVSRHPKVVSGEMSVDEVLRDFSSDWDIHDKNGKITFAEFADYYNGISASVDNDELFDLMIRSAWKLPMRY